MEDEDLLNAAFENVQRTKKFLSDEEEFRQIEDVPYDPIDFEPIRFDLPPVPDMAITKPFGVNLCGPGRVEWWTPDFFGERVPISDAKPVKVLKIRKGQQCLSPIKGRRKNPGLLKSFLALEQGSDEDIVNFIDTWGFLGINTVLITEQYTHHSERTDTYRQWAKRIRALMRLASEIQNGRKGDLVDWELWIKGASEARDIASYIRAFRSYAKYRSPDKTARKVCDYPLVVAAKKQIAWGQNRDLCDWDWHLMIFNESPPEKVVEYMAQCLDTVINDWITTKVNYYFDVRGDIGYARPFTHRSLAKPMEQRFWDQALGQQSVLLPLGHALLHNLQSSVVLCKECNQPVPDPSPDVRKGFKQCCSLKCERIADRKKSKKSYAAKIKARAKTAESIAET